MWNRQEVASGAPHFRIPQAPHFRIPQAPVQSLNSDESTIYLAEFDRSVQESIAEDLRKLKAFQDDFCDKGPRCFKHVCHTNMFVFLHGTHLAFSRVLYSMFKAVLDISSSVHECLEICDAAADTHLNLEPFCRDNHGLLKYYEKKGLPDKKT